MPAHVLVTGAAGLIGSAVLDLLAATGITTTALILEPADVRADRTLIGDAGDPRLVADAVDGTDAVIHLAAIPRPGLDPDEEIVVALRLPFVGAPGNRLGFTAEHIFPIASRAAP